MMRRFFIHRSLSLILVSLLVFLAACRNDAPGDAPAAQRPASSQAVPTMPPAQFTAVAQQVFTDTMPAAVAESASDATATPASTASPDLSRGATVYANRCASCHGEQGEGVAGEAQPLTEFELSYSEFDTLLRTGGNGSLGNEHLFGPNMISPSGMQALYAYVQSLLD